MGANPLVERLLAETDPAARDRLLADHAAGLDAEFAAALKACADDLLRADTALSLTAARLLQRAGEIASQPTYRALGLLAEANVLSIGKGEYAGALMLYDEAAGIYGAAGCVADEARSQIGRVWALACLGRYQEADEAAAWAGDVLLAHGWLGPLATLTMNTAILHGRQGDDRGALERFDRAREIYARMGEAGEPFLPWIEQNRGIVLRNLGRFQESLAASESALEGLTRFGHAVEAARAEQNLGVTCFVLGRYNEALQRFDRARDVFVADGRQRDALLLDLFAADCLLELRRFAEALDKCRGARSLFESLGSRYEAGQALLDEAVAYAGLGRNDEALASLAEARALFVAEENPVMIATADLERAALRLRQGAAADARADLARCIETFQAQGLPVRAAQAQVVAARVALALGDVHAANSLAGEALAFAGANGLASLAYPCHYLLGQLARSNGDGGAALAEWDAAIAELERLRGRLMVEFRVDFLEDKNAVYEDAVALSLELGRPADGLAYAERAKSRVLRDLLANRLDLSLHARSQADTPLVAELARLRAERDRLYRRYETREEVRVRGREHEVQQEVLALEQRITVLWHRLLIANADYARDAALWQSGPEPVQPYLPADAMLVEYFIARGRVIAFLVTPDAIRAVTLPADPAALARQARLLRLNLGAVPHAGATQAASLAENARALLGQVYVQVFAPLAEAAARWPRLILAPHGPLHYLPLHALFDGERYLFERHEISYLPGASVLRYCVTSDAVRMPDNRVSATAFGSSWGGRLPNTVAEAEAVAALLGGQAVVEGAATLSRLRAEAPRARILHLAAHGEYRADNPLFSGLALDDGWLTTLDVFGLDLHTDLVTLSACQTGQSTVAAGDELLGLMRAFLHAGASALLLSGWAVEDASTAAFMSAFYRALVGGMGKAAALRSAQQAFVCGEIGDGAYAHPYFWAPFMLVGAPV